MSRGASFNHLVNLGGLGTDAPTSVTLASDKMDLTQDTAVYVVNGEGSANDDLDGIDISDGRAGQFLLIIPATGLTITLKDENAGADATSDRIRTPGGTDLALADDEAALLWHNTTLDRWVVIGTTKSGGGAVDSVFGRTGAVVATTNDYTWAQIDKATSSIADITTRSHTALTDIGSNSHATIDTHISATAAHGATGAVVGTTNTQTLSAKTLTTPTISATGFTNAQHAHAAANSGGTLTTLGTVTTGNVDAVVSQATTSLAGKAEFATAAEINTGTSTTHSVGVDQFVASNRNLRFMTFVLVAAATANTVQSSIGGRWYLPFTGTLVQADATPYWFSASTTTAGTTGTMVVDIHKNGTTVMTTNKLNIDTGEFSTGTAATLPDLTTTAITAGDYLEFDVDAIHTTPANGLIVTIAIRIT